MPRREVVAPSKGRGLYTLPVVLFAAIDTEAVSIDDIRAWADRQILQSRVPPPRWLIALSLSTTRREATDAVLTFALPDDIAELLVGLTYLRFRRGEITREQLVANVGVTLDAYNASLMERDVEGWYAQMAGNAPLPRAEQAMLDELAAKADVALSRLLNSQIAAEEAFWSGPEFAPAFPCPACGFFTMDEPPGSYSVCRVCGWEDDHVQLAYPRMGGGANRESLVEAQAVALKRFPIEVQSAAGFERDRSWRPLRDDEQLPRDDTPRSGDEYFQAAASDSVGYYWKK